MACPTPLHMWPARTVFQIEPCVSDFPPISIVKNTKRDWWASWCAVSVQLVGVWCAVSVQLVGVWCAVSVHEKRGSRAHAQQPISAVPDGPQPRRNVTSPDYLSCP